MSNQQLIDYIKQARSAGQSDAESKKILQNNEWPEKEIDEAFKECLPSSGLIKHKLPLKKILTISLGGIFILALTAGAAYYYYTEYTPKIVIKKALENMQNVKSFHFKANFKITGQLDDFSPFLMEKESDAAPLASLFSAMTAPYSEKTDSPKDQLVTLINAEGNIDSQDKQNTKLDLKININIEEPEKISSYVKASLIALNQKVYFKIDKISVPGETPIDSMDEWVQFDLDGLAQLTGQEGFKEEMERRKQKNLENTEKLQQLIQESEKMFIIKDLGDAEINQIKAHQYDINFDKQELINFIKKAIALYQQDAGEKNEHMPSSQELEEFVELLTSSLKIEIWIGKKDKLIHKMIFAAQELEVVPKIKTGLYLEIVFSNFNQSMNFTEPKDAIKLKELMDFSFLESSLESKQKAQDARAESDLRMIQTALEMYYGDNLRYQDLPDGAAPIGPNQNISHYLNPVPQNAGNPENPYYWYDNGDNDTFCVYYKYEAAPETYFYVSHRGAGKNDKPYCEL